MFHRYFFMNLIKKKQKTKNKTLLICVIATQQEGSSFLLTQLKRTKQEMKFLTASKQL